VERLGEGGRSTVYLGRWRGADVAVKVYKPSAVARHARKHPVPLARFEFERNRAFHEAPGLAAYVARPLAHVVEPGISVTLQERLEGELYYFHYTRLQGRVDPELGVHLARIVELAHAADLYDVDLHAMNVMVVEGPAGKPWPKLFDFNLIPFHERPPNPLVGFLLRTGLMSVRARDLRKLRNFHDFRRVERKLLGFYESP
jgi:serine/threonine protein kinase